MKFTVSHIAFLALSLAGLAICIPAPAIASVRLQEPLHQGQPQETSVLLFGSDKTYQITWSGDGCLDWALDVPFYVAEGCALLYQSTGCNGAHVEIRAGERKERVVDDHEGVLGQRVLNSHSSIPSMLRTYSELAQRAEVERSDGRARSTSETIRRRRPTIRLRRSRKKGFANSRHGP
ncbi:hypothetical protein DFH07DRAFT_779468 [Mycena maculata]|uniref:Uncharacterized protein n=1 Tax=Mycena maculata TaxID=230809 RepID=A0AAD7I833_9AGAR|nr:hypothetical protein DFH07DRAFT_779468 [Mycena maculata]